VSDVAAASEFEKLETSKSRSASYAQIAVAFIGYLPASSV